jgi:hypothetical protein
LSAIPSRPEPLVPTFSIVKGTPASRRKAERLAHPAGRGGARAALRGEALEVIAAGLAQTSLGIDPVWTPGTRRRYACLLDTALYDAWLIEWSPSSGLELHDHGGSHGVVAVAAGTLVETYTDLQGRHPLYTRLVAGGEIFSVPATRVHEVSNPGPGEARSVHVYSPPLREMTFYDHRSGSFLSPLSTSQGDLAVLEQAAT